MCVHDCVCFLLVCVCVCVCVYNVSSWLYTCVRVFSPCISFISCKLVYISINIFTYHSHACTRAQADRQTDRHTHTHTSRTYDCFLLTMNLILTSTTFWYVTQCPRTIRTHFSPPEHHNLGASLTTIAIVAAQLNIVLTGCLQDAGTRLPFVERLVYIRLGKSRYVQILTAPHVLTHHGDRRLISATAGLFKQLGMSRFGCEEVSARLGGVIV